MASCALAPRPKRGVQLEEWQEYTISTIQAYLHQASQERMPLTPIVCNFPNFSNERHHIVPWLSYRIQRVCQQGDAHAERLAREALATHQGIKAAAFDGISFVSPYGWCYEEDSWRPTNNKKLCYLARSMLNGYRLDKPIQSRTNDLIKRLGRQRFAPKSLALRGRPGPWAGCVVCVECDAGLHRQA